MRATRPGLCEYEIQAILEYQFRRRGASGCAYPTTAAGGPNSCVLHHQGGDRPLEAGDLLLLDGGAEFELYASDVTRTFPVTGRFSADQAALYDVVLAAQEAAIDKVKPGATLQEVHEAALGILVDGMIRLGLLSGPRSEIVSRESYKRFFMHPTSHWLGLDVHDVGRYKIGEDWRPLEPGMVFSVEPGLYVPEDDLEADPRFRGMGIRIEDDVFVTPEGNQVLSSGVPKARDEIERLMAEG
jgi:Xaa-Pro aminopeptidase